MASAAFLAPALLGPAAARAEIGPTSSQEITISVSIAAQYGLRASPSPAQALAASERFCMASNGQPAALPILLVQSGPAQSGETAQPIPWCALGGAAAVQGARHGTAGRSSRLLIIRPE